MMMLTMTANSPKCVGVDHVADDPEFWETVKNACRQDQEEQQVMTSEEITNPLSEKERADESEVTEYVEDMEPVDDDKEQEGTTLESPAKSPGKKKSRCRKCKDQPDYQWQNSPSATTVAPQKSPASTGKSDRAARRGKLTRAASFDGMTDCSKFLSEEKRISWDRGSRPKPDFRWDKFMDLDGSNDSQDSQDSCDKKGEKQPRRRKRLPRRTKSDITGYDMPGRVRFCFRSTVCVEVPRATKDMKPDLYYTKQEIKDFKAERREEKQLVKLEKLEARLARTSLEAPGAARAPIAGTC